GRRELRVPVPDPVGAGHPVRVVVPPDVVPELDLTSHHGEVVTLGVLLVGHGSRRPEANAVLPAVAAALAERGPWVVRHAFLELVAPTIDDGFDSLVAAGCTEVVAHPYFLYAGNHSAVDIPRLLAAAAGRHAGVHWRVSAP